MKHALLPLLALFALPGCVVTPEQRVNAALQDAGVPPRVAGCMAERMAARLSITQLKELKALAKEHAPGEKVSAKHILKRVAALGDPEIVTVTSRAAIGCYIAG
jgi:hypothetical protein